MSASAAPISPTRFAAALESLSLSSLYAKVSELQNSIAHLEASNAELEEYARKEDDTECYEALVENKEVVERMRERIGLVRKEVVEVRGLPWMPEAEGVEVGERRADGGVEGVPVASNGGSANNGTTQGPVNNGTGADAEGGEEGVFL
ncbi:hypothetical protein CC80DRAFT_148225 [Byssothecium circinans]|uniref:Uncharacterized protein n=1 Tax=Byssothecium circinans TaxID=147558 RepID=A0A6A5TL41_9PLEO|nr:hypothetical protein CC80DRAFT_148225 [Byssothecium circinans]